MKHITVFLMLVFVLSSCNAQTKNKKEGKAKPKIDYKVNKEYDKDGNLIKYDSIYTYYYSNIDKEAMLKDSIFKQFDKHINLKNPFMNETFFDNFFKKDAFIEDDFFTEDYFRESFKKNQEMMDKMLSRMDSIKNKFLLNQYPLKEKALEPEK